MSTKKSINDIKISETREDFNKRKVEKKKVSKDEKEVKKSVASYKKKNKKSLPIIVASVAALTTVILIISFFFHSATIEVSSKKENISFKNDVYTGIFFQGVSSKEETEQRKSVGKIRIINNTKTAQILREETRFEIEGQQDIVYKIFKRTVIQPSKDVVVEAYSDGMGEEFNQKAGVGMQIPGFREAKMFDEFDHITGVIEEDFVFMDSLTQVSKDTEEMRTLGSTHYEVLLVEAQSQTEVASIGEEKVLQKAEGKIKIINDTNQNQKLRKETRFEVDGLIFKTVKSVTIPAKSSVIADAFADEAGRKYNISAGVDMQIPGFKEANMEDEYQKITGVTYTEFTRGMIGSVNVPNKNELEKAETSLAVENAKLLSDKIQNHTKKDEYIFLPSIASVETKVNIENEGEGVVVSVSGLQRVPVIKKEDFLRMILKSDQIPEEKLRNIEIKDFSKLDFQIVNEDNFDINSENNMIFSINGQADISWSLDQDMFLQKVRGNDLDELKEFLEDSYHNFDISLNTFPQWRSSLPSDIENIELIVK